MALKKITGYIHLWLGLASGLVVVIVALTGCIYVFQAEIQNFTQPYRFVQQEKAEMLPPSVLRKIADKALPGKKIHSVEYGKAHDAAKAIYFNFDPAYYYLVYLNPYSGEVLKVKNMDRDFFRIIIEGHYYLWLPPAIGKPVVAISTLIFVILLITGLILWWPKTKKALKASLTLNWKAGWRRKNYDLHNVVGFYATLFALVIALTGLVWGFQWFAKTVYYTASGGKTMIDYYDTFSDTTQQGQAIHNPVDILWERAMRQHPNAEIIEPHFPEQGHTIAIAVNTDASTFWKTDYKYYDQFTLKEVPVTHVYGSFNNNLSVADKLMRMNYDIHTGGILGLPGKIIAFFVSLICASLPITGFYIWWNKKRQKRHSLLSELD